MYSPPFTDTNPLTTSLDVLLGDAGDLEFRTLIHNLLGFGARLREIRDSLGALIGLSGPTYTMLISVARLEDQGEVNVASLTRHLSVSQPFVTAQVQKLVAEGLLEKAPSMVDGRSVSLTTTGAGRRLLARLAPDQREINDVLFASLSREDFDSLSRTMSTLVPDAGQALALADRLLDPTDRQGATA